jgi:hypothetical protein
MKEFLIESEIYFIKDLANFEGTSVPSKPEIKEKIRIVLEQFEEIESLEEEAKPNPKLGAITKKIINIYAKEYTELMTLAQQAKLAGNKSAATKFEARAKKAKQAIDSLNSGSSKVGTAVKVLLFSLNLAKFSLGTVLLIASVVFGLSAAVLGVAKTLHVLGEALAPKAWTSFMMNTTASLATKAATNVVTAPTVSTAVRTFKHGVTGKGFIVASNPSIFLAASAQVLVITLILFSAIVALKKIAVALYTKKLANDIAKQKAREEVIKALNKATAAAAKAKPKKAA